MTPPKVGAYDWRYELQRAINDATRINQLQRRLLHEPSDVVRSQLIAEVGLILQEHTQRLNDLRNYKQP